MCFLFHFFFPHNSAHTDSSWNFNDDCHIQVTLIDMIINYCALFFSFVVIIGFWDFL